MQRMRDRKVLPTMVAIILMASALLNCSCSPLYAEDTATRVNILNSAPSVSVELTPDDDPVTPGMQVINPDPGANKTVTIIANVTDMNGHDDLSDNDNITANITGHSIVEDNPVSLSLCGVVNVATVTYKGSFNISSHSEGDYKVEVTATDFAGLTGTGSKNFTYLYATLSDTTTYDFTSGVGLDKWAFRKQHFDKPPATNDVPSIKFSSNQYNRIKKNDGSMQIDRTSRRNCFAIHRFLFNIAESEASITKIDISWIGLGFRYISTNGATLYIWNFNTGKYEQLDSSNQISMQLNGEIANSIADYIDANGNLTIVAEQNAPQETWFWWWFRQCSIIGTDYVRVNVTYTPQQLKVSHAEVTNK